MRETSPHTRGKPNEYKNRRETAGNIPAYAGKAFQSIQLQEQQQKHPRIRGESVASVTLVGKCVETSPHTRGKLASMATSLDVLRNIPAYAGKAVSFYRQVGSYQKHPRIRGESVDLPFERVDDSETSPHTRGKRACGYSTRCSDGNIPAYAGKAVVILKLQRTCKKHPRIRGESPGRARNESTIWETSPHTRGKQVKPTLTRPHARNIPAYAGKAEIASAQERMQKKHPRIRGESSGHRSNR